MKNKRARLIAQAASPNSGKFFKLKLAIGVLITAGFIYLAWYSYNTQISNISESELPLIKAPTEPVKYKPEDPGGLKIEHKDKEIYDHISGKKSHKTEHIKDDYDEPDTYEKIKKSIGLSGKAKQKEVKVKPIIIKLPASNTKKYRKVIKPPTFHIRVAAIKSPSVKTEAWNILQNKYPELKPYASKVTTKIKSGKKLYFLDVIAIKTKSRAIAICNKITKAGGKCKVY
ncbi:MAG: hypothetical protein RLN62_03025 [Rickettsiales bacterium]